MWLWLWLCAILCGIVFIAGAIVSMVHRSYIYQPNTPSRKLQVFPKDYGFEQYEDVRIIAKDGTSLHAWFIFHTPKDSKKKPNNKLPTCVFLHGNAGNISHRLANAHYIMNTCECHILLLSYRGYGHSEGSPSESGLVMDAEAGVEYVLAQSGVDASKVFVFGRSLGGAVALSFAAHSKLKVAAVIVENTFTSVADMRNLLFPIAQTFFFIFFLVRESWSNSKHVTQLSPSQSVLFICGTSDSLVPPEMARQLFATCVAEHKSLLEVEGGDHNNTWSKGGDRYFEKISAFLREAYRNGEGKTQ